ncbi:hypothetical protein BGX33_002568, partial [Mortierella sp. NVP41]
PVAKERAPGLDSNQDQEDMAIDINLNTYTDNKNHHNINDHSNISSNSNSSNTHNINNGNNTNNTNNYNSRIVVDEPDRDNDNDQGNETDDGNIDDDETTIFRRFIRSPSGTPWPTFDIKSEHFSTQSSPLDPSPPSHQPSADDDIFSKPVVDHLVEIFFEHCFQDFDFFNPLAFLRLYAKGDVNPCLLDIVCGVACRFSDHPAIAKKPAYLSGIPFVDRVRAKMPVLMSVVSIDTMHTLILLANHEYIAGRAQRGYRIEGLIAVMAPNLHLNQRQQQQHQQHPQSSLSSSSSETQFESEAERIAVESKIRTLTFLLMRDLMSSAVSGIAPLFDHSTVHVANPSTDISWWMERPRGAGSTPKIEIVDDFTASILYKILRPRPIRGHILRSHVLTFRHLVHSVCALVKTELTLEKWKEHHDSSETEGNSSNIRNNSSTGDKSDSCSGSGSGSGCGRNDGSTDSMSNAVSSPSMDTSHSGIAEQDTAPQWTGDQSEYSKLDSGVELWKAQLPLEFRPSHGKLSLFRTDFNVLNVGSCYYALAILLHRPTLIPGVVLSDTSFANTSAPPEQRARQQHRSSRGRKGISRGGRAGGGGGTGGIEGGGNASRSNSGSRRGGGGGDQHFAEDMEGIIFTDCKEEEETDWSMPNVERTPLDICTEAANEMSAMTEQFTDEQIKYRGYMFAFQVFLAGVTHITNMITSKDARVVAYSRERLDRCHHFLREVAPYWASAEDQTAVLHGLVSSHGVLDRRN